MKRPGGFDGAPEPRRGAESQGSGSGSDGRGGGDDAGRAPLQPGLDRLFRRFGAARGADPERGSDAGSALGSGPSDGAGPRADSGSGAGRDAGDDSETGGAPTIDLSEVRRARGDGANADGAGAGGGAEAGDADAADAGNGEADRSAGGDLVVASPPRGLSALSLRRRESAEDPVRAAEREVRDAARRRRARERREQRRFSAQARRRRRNWLIAGGVVAGLVVFVAVGVLTPLMAVRDVQVEGAALVNAEEVTGTLQRFEGVPLALVDDREVHEALEPFPLIQRYAIERIPPHTLLVRIEERVPVVSLERGGGFELYDAAGVLLGRSDSPPEGVPQGADGLSDVSSESFRAAAEVLRDMPAELRAQVSTASANSPQNVRFVLTSGTEVLWGDASRSQRKAVVLASMIRALAERPVEVIDVSSVEGPVFR